jgi:hypothetical protein
MINPMQAAYVRILRKIKQKADGESALAKELVNEGIEKLLDRFAEEPGIVEASRKLYTTTIKTYKTSSQILSDIAKDSSQLLFNKFKKSACSEIFLIYSSAIIQYLTLNDEERAQSTTDAAIAFFNQCNCPEQAINIAKVIKDPKSKSDIKLF